MNPKYPIYLFSSLSEDAGSLDKIKNLHRIKLDNEFASEKFTIDDFKESLVIYDDTDNISSIAIKKQLEAIENLILDTGRHSKTYLIRTSQMATNGAQTKHILAESQSITFYPSTLGDRAMKYLLEQYIGLGSKQVQKIKEMGKESRWITIYTSMSPRIIMSENCIMTQDQL